MAANEQKWRYRDEKHSVNGAVYGGTADILSTLVSFWYGYGCSSYVMQDQWYLGSFSRDSSTVFVTMLRTKGLDIPLLEKAAG